jgi:hypothetical protein
MSQSAENLWLALGYRVGTTPSDCFATRQVGWSQRQMAPMCRLPFLAVELGFDQSTTTSVDRFPESFSEG